MRTINDKITSELLENLNLVIGDVKGIDKFVHNLLLDSPFIAVNSTDKSILNMFKENSKLIGEAKHIKALIIKDIDDMDKKSFSNYTRELLVMCNRTNLKLVLAVKNLDLITGMDINHLTTFAVGDKGQFVKVKF